MSGHVDSSFAWIGVRLRHLYFYSCLVFWLHHGLSHASPALIDRAQFFGDSAISAGTLAPNGCCVAYLRRVGGAQNIWIKKRQDFARTAVAVSNESYFPVGSFLWTSDSKHIVYLKDGDGDENYGIVVKDIHDTQTGLRVSSGKRFDSFHNKHLRLLEAPQAKSTTVLVGDNTRDPHWYDVRALDVDTGEDSFTYINVDRVNGWLFDTDGTPLLLQRNEVNGDTNFFTPTSPQTPILTCSVLETCSALALGPESEQAWIVSNVSRSTSALFLYDMKTGAHHLADADPNNVADLFTVLFSNATRRPLLSEYDDAHSRVYTHSISFARKYKRLTSKLRQKTVELNSHSLDDRYWGITAYKSDDPGAFYVWDSKNDRLTLQWYLYPGLPRKEMGNRISIQYQSTDKKMISAYLTLPKGVQPSNLPLILLPHGGPWTRDYDVFDVRSQFFANRGYAVLQPNFRGSSGFGTDFLNAGNQEWGGLMQADLTAGVNYLVRKSLVDPKRVAIIGSSYGGYAALAGATFTPDLYAAAIAVSAPTDLNKLISNMPPSWEAEKRRLLVRVGDPSTPKEAARLWEKSPISKVNTVTAPLFIVQGIHDPRVHEEQTSAFVNAARSASVPVTYWVAKDEGHTLRKEANLLAFYAEVEYFLHLHLHGAFQESMTPETRERIRLMEKDQGVQMMTK